MLEIRQDDQDLIRLIGRLDATQAEMAREILSRIKVSSILDFKELSYISSAGIGVLLSAQKRLSHSGQELKLTNLNQHIRELFKLAGLEFIFKIE